MSGKTYAVGIAVLSDLPQVLDFARREYAENRKCLIINVNNRLLISEN